MPNLVERRLAVFLPRDAERFIADHNGYCGQRPIRPAHVAFLAKKMKEGLFLTSELAYATLPDGRSVIVDGQHSVNACILSGVPFNASVYGYTCKDEADLFTLYSETDQGLRRTRADVVRAGRNIMPAAVREIPHGLVSLFGAAILMAPLAGGRPMFHSRSITAQGRVFAVCAKPDEARFLFDFQATGVTNRIPVRMAMVATFRVAPERARLFWEGVTRPEHLPAHDPRRLLHHLLAGGKGGVMSALAVREMYVRCIAHWNAHVTDMPVEDFDAERPPAPACPTRAVPVLAHAALPAVPQTFTANPSAMAGTYPQAQAVETVASVQ